MIDIKCPSCGAPGRVPPYKVNVRLICKKCLKPFHITPARNAVLGDPPVQKDAAKGGKPGAKGARETAEAFDEMASKLSKVKLPQVSPTVLGIILAVGLVLGLGYWLFSKQSLEQRSEIVANTLIKGDMKSVIDLCVPGTELDAMMWYGQIARKFNELKLAFGGEDPAVNIHVQGDTKGGSAMVVAIYSRQGSRIASPDFVESLAPIPSLSNSNQTLEMPLFWVKDLWGNWVLDGKRTALGTIPNQ
jgi:hypothetical protein